MFGVDDAVIGSVIGGVASAGIQTLGSILYGNYSYDKSRTDTLAQWQRETEYNKPINQMARLKEAGLNPRLVYGKGADALASPAPTAPMPHANIANVLDNAGAIAQVRNLDATHEVIQNDAELRKGQIAVTGQQHRGLKMEMDALSDIQANTGIKLSPNTPDDIKQMAYMLYIFKKRGVGEGLAYAAPAALKGLGQVFKGVLFKGGLKFKNTYQFLKNTGKRFFK